MLAITSGGVSVQSRLGHTPIEDTQLIPRRPPPLFLRLYSNQATGKVAQRGDQKHKQAQRTENENRKDRKREMT